MPHARRRSSFAAVESLEARRLFAAGDLDLSYGGGDGRVDAGWRGATGMVGLPDGRVLIYGDHAHSKLKVNLEVRRADGTLDATFGTGGRVRVPHGAVQRVVPLPDGKLLAIGAPSILVEPGDEGSPNVYDDRRYLTRYHADGSIDRTFGVDGTLDLSDTLAHRDSEVSVASVAVQPDGKILVGDQNEADVYRLNADGSIDASFGKAGRVRLIGLVQGINVSLQYVGPILVQPDGKILVASGDAATTAVVRLKPDGSGDLDFGRRSIARATVHSANRIDQLHLLPDGGILAARVGRTPNGVDGDRITLVKFNAQGGRDATFNADASPGELGISVAPVGEAQRVTALLVQSDGKVVVHAIAGDLSGVSGVGRSIAVRYHGDGTLDTSFGTVVTGSTRVAALSAGDAILAYGDGGLRRLQGDDSAEPSPVTLAGGTVSIAGTGAAEDLWFNEFHGSGDLMATRNGFGRVFAAADVARVSANGGGGDDVLFVTSDSLDATLAGGAGDDRLISGGGDDRLLGNAGRDTLISGAGDDHLSGHGGHDLLVAEQGLDTLAGGRGNDRFLAHGDAAIDHLFGNRGDDSASADPDDLLDAVEALLT